MGLLAKAIKILEQEEQLQKQKLSTLNHSMINTNSITVKSVPAVINVMKPQAAPTVLSKTTSSRKNIINQTLVKPKIQFITEIAPKPKVKNFRVGFISELNPTVQPALPNLQNTSNTMYPTVIKTKSIALTTTTNSNQVVIKKQIRKLHKLIAATALTFMLQLGLYNTFDKASTIPTRLSFKTLSQKIELTNITESKEEVKKQPITVNKEAVLNVTQQEQLTSNDKEVIIKEATNEFTQGLQSKVTKQDREVLARMLYGEAGRGADPFEILHTVLNRASSPLFKGSITDIVLQKNQYVGYSPDLPLTNDYLTMVDMAIADWEANNCQKIDGCNHYYFVTGIPGVCNKFEISPENNNGRWVPKSLKKYAKLQEYCPVATEQAERFFTARDGQKPESMTK